jgi:hypothetical protein
VRVKVYKTIILRVVLYGCETWSLILRRKFGLKRDEIMGEWRKLHSGELHNLYSSPDIIRQIRSRRMRWVGHGARMGDGRNCRRFRCESPEEKGRWLDYGVDGRMR